MLSEHTEKLRSNLDIPKDQIRPKIILKNQRKDGKFVKYQILSRKILIVLD